MLVRHQVVVCPPVRLAVLLLLLLVAGCALQSYEPQPLQVRQTYSELTGRSLDAPELRKFMRAHGRPADDGQSPVWDEQALVLAALYLNPDMQVALAEWRLQQAGEVTAAQRINPNLNVPLEWHTDTGDGQSPWMIGLVFDLVFERRGKRAARIERAELQSAAARIAVDEVAWQVRGQVRQALASLAVARAGSESLQRRIEVVEATQQLLGRRQELGQMAAFELNRNRLELQRLRLGLSEQRRQVAAARNRLAAAIGITPDKLATINIELPDAAALPAAESVPAADVQGLALRERYDIRMALLEYAAQEAALRLQIEKQYPDINLSPGFVFDQSDNVWELGSAWVLPLFHNHEGEIAEAMARRRLLQARFIDLQAGVIARVANARSEYLGRRQTYREARELKAEADRHAEQMRRQFEAGYADRLQFLRARQVAAEADQALVDSRAALLSAHAALEQTLQHELNASNRTAAVVADLVDKDNAAVAAGAAGTEGETNP